MNIKTVFQGKKIRYWLISLIVVLIALFTLLRFNPARAGNAAADSTLKVTSMSIAETVDASGSLEAQPLANLTWKISGVVEEVNVKAGDKVKAGDVLMKLKTSSVSSNVISAQADLATAQKDLDDLLSSSSTDLAQTVIDLRDAQQAYDRAVNYLEFLQRSQQGIRQTQSKTFIETINRGAKKYVFQTKEFKMPANADWITEAENDVALKQAELDAAQRTYNSLKLGADAQAVAATQAKIDAAQSTIDTMSIIAPFDGEVLYVESKPNDVVNTDTFALSMANLDRHYIESQVSEADIADFKVGDPVTATLDAMPDLKLTGKVAAVDSLGKVNSNAVEYTVRVDLDKVAEDVSLPLGATANMTIEVKPATASLTVPVTAIQNDSKGEYVLVVQADGSTKRVDVVSSTIVGDRVVVTGDLKAGDSLTTSQKGNAAPRGPFGRGN